MDYVYNTFERKYKKSFVILNFQTFFILLPPLRKTFLFEYNNVIIMVIKVMVENIIIIITFHVIILCV
jgi:hypothetical protein